MHGLVALELTLVVRPWPRSSTRALRAPGGWTARPRDRRRHRARTLEDDEAIARRIVRLCAPLPCVPDSGSPALSLRSTRSARSNTCSIVTGIRPAPPAQLASLRRVALRCCTAGHLQSLRPHQRGDRVDSGTVRLRVAWLPDVPDAAVHGYARPPPGPAAAILSHPSPFLGVALLQGHRLRLLVRRLIE